MKHKLFKIGAAAAITVTGVGAAATMHTVSAATYKTAIKRVKIKYLPGQGLKIWTSYSHGRFMGYRAREGTVWNVVKTALDQKGHLWYMVGDDEWIQARYTEDITPANLKNTQPIKIKKSRLARLANKAKQTVKRMRPTRVTASEVKTEKKEAKREAQADKLAAKKANVKQAKLIVSQTLQGSTQHSSGTVKAIIALAKAQVGKNYVWGATGPNAFDCSGLVQYVYAKNGVNLPRTTYDQVKVGQTVSLKKLQPGDLLFWGSATAPYHVAIYIGNNRYINAATPKQGVILQTISTYYYPTLAKRVL